MKILKVEQGTKEWHEGRRGKVTGTKLKHVMGGAEGRRGLIAELIAEEATEQSKAPITSIEMERGNAEEIFAIKAYEKRYDIAVDRIGMCISEEFDWVALSPDGLIPDATGTYTEAIEVKSPDSKKAILYKIENIVPMEETGLMGKKGEPLASAPFLGIPSEYKWQAIHYFVVNDELKTLNFCIYDARIIDDELKLYVIKLDRSNEILQEAIAEAKTELVRFRADWLAWRQTILPTNF